ncbi:MAG: laccase domain-containing protein [Gammaproteobacteria bacterium AqS3]|nr:laccase domain-containing protein [Gammaproteobacteria bacterium AqS3]
MTEATEAWVERAGLRWLEPKWNVPGVCAVSLSRAGGSSAGAWAGLNLSDAVGDDPEAVEVNRSRVRDVLGVQSPDWIRQRHGIAVARAGSGPVIADALLTQRSRASRTPCAILSADCLPVVLAARDGRAVGIAHAGWRGLLAGVVPNLLRALDLPSGELSAWLAPCIGPEAFWVGPEVRRAYLMLWGEMAEGEFVACHVDRWQMNLAGLAERQLRLLGVEHILRGSHCTHRDADTFYSYRREQTSGRQATLAWLE